MRNLKFFFSALLPSWVLSNFSLLPRWILKNGYFPCALCKCGYNPSEDRVTAQVHSNRLKDTQIKTFFFPLVKTSPQERELWHIISPPFNFWFPSCKMTIIIVIYIISGVFVLKNIYKPIKMLIR